MKPTPRTEIVDIVKIDGYEDYLYRCLTGPHRRYSRRVEYLREAIPEGFHKKLLVSNGNVVGQIEYGPPKASYYPISGQDLVVMNCIWVLRKAKEHNLGKLLVKDMVNSENHACMHLSALVIGVGVHTLSSFVGTHVIGKYQFIFHRGISQRVSCLFVKALHHLNLEEFSSVSEDFFKGDGEFLDFEGNLRLLDLEGFI